MQRVARLGEEECINGSRRSKSALSWQPLAAWMRDWLEIYKRRTWIMDLTKQFVRGREAGIAQAVGEYIMCGRRGVGGNLNE